MKIIASDYDGTLNYGGIDDTKRDAIQKYLLSVKTHPTAEMVYNELIL